ncbi:MAG: AAA family ATPase [Candidatus Binataceae bacterium]|jgi:hypothetical protein
MTLVIPEAFGGIPLKRVGDLQPYIKGLLYGKPGAGKTFFSAQASKVPAMSPCLVMTPDATEADTLREAAPDAVHAKINNFEEFWDIYRACAVGLDDPDKIPFKTIIMDTGTEAQKMNMRDIMAKLMITGRPGGGEVNMDVPSVREWGQSSSEMRRILRSFRDLPVNFIVNCHEQESRDNRGVNWYKPDLPGKLTNQVAGMFSLVGYVYINAKYEKQDGRNVVVDEKRCLLTGFVDGFVTKSRAGTLPRVMEDPQMATLYELITGKPAA